MPHLGRPIPDHFLTPEQREEQRKYYANMTRYKRNMAWAVLLLKLLVAMAIVLLVSLAFVL